MTGTSEMNATENDAKLGGPMRGRARRRSRADQTDANRSALLKAAAQVVGEEGYLKASVGRITAAAGLGNGTFYSYFESRQELFDILLPEVSKEMRALERARVAAEHSVSLVKMEEASFRAFADYVIANPWYARILLEAETAAPAAATANSELVLAQHGRRLMEAWKRGELEQYEQSEVPALSTILLDLRRHFVRTRLHTYAVRIPAEQLIEVSVKVIVRALTCPSGPRRNR